MSYQDALADLQSEFGKKKLLTAEDIAEHIGKTPNAQAALRSRDRFPIPQRSVGGRIVVSIYDLAHFIGDETQPKGAPRTGEPADGAAPSRANRRNFAQKPDQRQKPMRRANLKLVRRSFEKRIADEELSLAFQKELLARLEAIELARELGTADKKSLVRSTRRV